MVLDLDGERVIKATSSRLSASRLREGMRDRLLLPEHSVHRPAEHKLADAQQCRLLPPVEKLMDLRTPPRCGFYRVIAGEISRNERSLPVPGAMALELAR